MIMIAVIIIITYSYNNDAYNNTNKNNSNNNNNNNSNNHNNGYNDSYNANHSYNHNIIINSYNRVGTPVARAKRSKLNSRTSSEASSLFIDYIYIYIYI